MEMTQRSSEFDQSYADFGWLRSMRQVRHHMSQRSESRKHMTALFKQVQLAEERMVNFSGQRLENKQILEIGPGQGMERALYFGQKNQVTGMDTDIIARGLEWGNYWQMLRTNGLGRVAKTLGRELVSNRPNRRVWKDLMGANKLTFPGQTYGNICEDVPHVNHYDAIMSWSVFEHVSDPYAAIDNVLTALKPGGFFYISLHLYTCNNGHHDIRSFTGQEDALPLWAHLRPESAVDVRPSAYLNEWRLSQWRELMEDRLETHVEVLEKFEHPRVYGPKLTGSLREELSDYSDEELLTVNAIYLGQKKK